jgi:hypothetical protein
VTRAVFEDLRNPAVLYLGTELGAFWSWNGGGRWVQLRSGLPTVAVNDLLVHPRDNDLVLATHGRGVWILDQVTALQGLTPEIASRTAWLFPIDPAEQTRYRGERAHTGNMIFEGENPPAAAFVDYWLRDAGTEVSLEVFDVAGARVTTVRAPHEAGVNRALWNLRYGAESTTEASRQGGGGGFARAGAGPLVVPGVYTVRLTVGEVTQERTVRVVEDPRFQVDPAVRARWTAELRSISSTLMEAQGVAREVQGTAQRLDGGEARAPEEVSAKVKDLDRELDELVSRLARLRGGAEGWVGPLSADQASQKAFLTGMLETLAGEWRAVRGRISN